MNLALLVGETRVLIGGPSVNTVPEREILSFLVPSIQWLAGHLKFDVRTDASIGLAAEQREYPLPPDFLYSVWVEVNGNLLQPNSVWNLNSGAVTTAFSGTGGQTWMTIASGTPSQYAIQNRQMILYPPPSAAYVATTPVMSWRYIGCGAYLTQEGSVGLTPAGIPALTELDLQCVRIDAAIGWLSAHLMGQPADQVQAMQAQIQALQADVNRRLPECKRRWMNMIEDYAPTMRPDTSGRFVAAR